MLILLPNSASMKLNALISRRRVVSWLAACIVFILIFLLARTILLRTALSSFSARMKAHHYLLHWEGAAFVGVKSLFIRHIYIQNENNVNEIYIDSLTLNVRVLPLLLKRVRLRELNCGKISIRYMAAGADTTLSQTVTHDSAGFFDRLAGKEPADLVNRNLRRFFSYVPSKTLIRSFETRLTYAGKTTVIGCRDLIMLKGRVTGTLVFSGESSTAEISVTARFDKSSYLAQVRMVNPADSLLPLPILRDRYGVEAGFDTVDISIDMSHHARHIVDLAGTFNLSGFKLGGERLSSSTFRIHKFTSSFLVHIGQKYIELDSSTSASLNNIACRPYMRIQLAAKPVVDFKLRPVTWNAGDFFSSLPEGMFTSLIGLKAEGMLHYYLNFSVDLNNPDSLKFDTRLTSENFRIIKYGTDDYRRINGSFYHEVYEQGKLKAAFMIGPENPDFIPLESISPFVRAAVMTSEDGSFYFHRGFNPGAFRESIVTNIREKRFARGGSTITMQLVKNVFLTRNKTVARKIEEALIVWLIENQGLVSKNRMYEVYLNMIEWGPGVYGINQASRFYFNKNPQDLNLKEGIFLASIIPRPKFYKYTFDTNGVPRMFFDNYFSRMKELMVRKQFIQPGDTVGVNSRVLLTGPASQVFAIPDRERDDIRLQELEIIPAIIE
jgi:hypothetical protein